MSTREIGELKDIPDPTPPSALDDARGRRILEAVSRETAPTRTELGRGRRFALGVSGIWVLGLLVVFGVRPDSASLPDWYVLSWLGVPLVLSLTALVVARRLGRGGLGLGMLAMACVTLGVPLVVMLLSLGLPPPRVTAPDASAWQSAFACFRSCLLFGSAPLVLASFAFRRAFPVLGTWRGALLGAASGSFAAAALNAHCPNVAALHLLLGHAVPVVLLTLLGALAGHRLLRA